MLFGPGIGITIGTRSPGLVASFAASALISFAGSAGEDVELPPLCSGRDGRLATAGRVMWLSVAWGEKTEEDFSNSGYRNVIQITF